MRRVREERTLREEMDTERVAERGARAVHSPQSNDATRGDATGETRCDWRDGRCDWQDVTGDATGNGTSNGTGSGMAR